jgi:hypothetical protein
MLNDREPIALDPAQGTTLAGRNPSIGPQVPKASRSTPASIRASESGLI